MPAPETLPAATARPAISVVIPVLHDTQLLGPLVGLLRTGVEAPAEIIVVDGSDQANCRELCRHLGCVHVATRAGRGHQLHAGARQARGEVLWFLHADATPPAGGIGRIRAAHAAGSIGGYFRFQFAGPPTWYKRALAATINLRARLGVPYGDQGLFVSRRAYEQAGGFPDQPLFEEVTLVRRLRRLGAFVPVNLPIGVSPRRWERDGWVWRSLANRLLALGYALGISPAWLARRYPAAGDDVRRPGREARRC